MESKEKRIETVELKVSEINTLFGNPRKISRKGIENLTTSLNRFGDFGIIVIDENNSVIAGNQRVSILKDIDPDRKVLCKRLINYTKAEKRAINIKDNRHDGEDDIDALAEWIADLNIDLGIDPDKEKTENEGKTIELLEPKRYEKYNYVLIVCRSEIDWVNLNGKLHLDNKAEVINNFKSKRKLKCRAVWYDELPVIFVEKKGEENGEQNL